MRIVRSVWRGHATQCDVARNRNKHFARTLRSTRRRLGESQRAFARRLNRGIDTLQNWEQGRSEPRGHTRKLILEQLQTFGQNNNK